MDILEIAAQFMEVSARTAPKSMGKDFISTKIISKGKLDKLADEMDRIHREEKRRDFDRDANSVRASGAILLIGLKNSDEVGLNCGGCGYPTCEEKAANRKKGKEFTGPLCVFRLLDMGIALGSAAKTASIFNFDSRIMYRIAIAAMNLGWIEWEVLMAIPISASGKSPFFDRKSSDETLNI
ncbi:MAG: hypothetical protein GF315_13615 [candidate division Zixibacteria bacterium]|nr:hypothetical protein [candidate division Zixibacteria bacterium]